MYSRPGSSKSKDNAKTSRRLSVAKKESQRGGTNANGKNKQRGSSITSFFKNTPPSKLACPLCGKFIHRFKINEHIDSQCQDFVGENSMEAPAPSHSEQEKRHWPRAHNDQSSPDKERNASMHVNDQSTKTSPYFKQNGSPNQESPKTRSKAKEVKMISLGSLASKISRNLLAVSEHSETDKMIVTADKEPDISEPSSSQKENYDGNLSIAPEHQSSPIATISAPQAEKFEEPVTTVETLASKASQSVKSATSSRLTKRKKEDSPATRAALNTQKKIRHTSSRSEISAFVNQIQIPSTNTGQNAGTVEPSPDLKRDHITQNTSVDLRQDGDSITVEQASPRRPYYLQNFVTVLEAVLENEDDRMLFNKEDLSIIHSFQQLSVPGQMLYVRLFQRKLKWLQVSKLDYAEISSDLRPVVQELVDSGFLQTDSELNEIQEVLDLLPAPEIRSLAKTFHLGGSGNSTPKLQLVEGLLNLSKQRSLFALAPGQTSTGAVILKRAKQLAGSCVRLRRDPRAVFSRVLLLFSLTDTMEEEEMASGGQGQLYTILLVNAGRLAFPAYTVQRSAQVFRDRDDLIGYEAAMRTLQEVIAAMQAGCWEDAAALYTSAKSNWQSLKQTSDIRWQEELPVFLRCFTAGWAYTRILSRGVEILQRLRRYEDAVEELRSLLSQSAFCPTSRGRWWDRLALNLQQHLKRHEQAIYAIKDGLNDPLVRTGHRLALHQRAARMKESASFKKFRLLLRDLPSIQVDSVTHVTIRGQLFPHEGGMGKSVFLRPGTEEESDAMVICSVEELALAHYRDLGFDQGIHGEGSTFSTLFGLLMWDVVFMEGIPDVFRTPYQTCPLDFHTDTFYENRKEAIETRVEMLREASTEVLQELLAEVWNSQEGKVCALVNWERFSSLQKAQSLVACLGGRFLSGVVLRMAKDYRHSRGGLPDLVVWNTSNNSYKLVEVKGPNDRLSQKQQLWLDELQKLGASVEVCHVAATGARGARLE